MNQINKTAVSFVTIEEGGQRIDNFLLTYLKDIPKSRIYRLIRKGEIRVNKKRIKPDYRLQTQDSVRLPPLVREEKIEKRAPDRFIEEVNRHVIYEDNYFIVLNKPSGLAVHGGSGISFGVIEALRQARKQEKFLELAHRLDRETSGCLLVVKKPSILKEVHQLLRDKGQVDKRYLALLEGKVRFKADKKVEAPLTKFELQSGERVVRHDEEGKPSVTYFTLLEDFGRASFVEARPITGRTHQIRVHACVLGHPIAGDEKYGTREFNREMHGKGLKRLFLHSNQLKFTLPSNNKTYEFAAPLPIDLKKVLESLKAG